MLKQLSMEPLMRREHVRRALVATTAGFAAVWLSAAADAADLLSPVPAPAPHPARAGPPAPQRGCRLVPQPQLNLWGEVTTYVPTWVCVTRGLYADQFPPPPPPQSMGITGNMFNGLRFW
jgi:hypothetical protein